ncbi:MAG: CPBP family intramembrane metalloprotease [Thermoflexales bacterium]|nr:CPBP family intramembrane metalloprotease [Thermoflexales bacterium]
MTQRIADFGSRVVDRWPALAARLRLDRLPIGWVALAYLAALTLGEALVTFSFPQAGMYVHSAMLLALMLHASLLARGPQRQFLLTLTLAPLIRLMSLSMPLPRFPFVYWYGIVGAPLIAAAYMAAWAAGLGQKDMGLPAFRLRGELSLSTLFGLSGRMLVQLIVGLYGLGLGYVEYLILRPAPLVESLRWEQLWMPVLILLVFTGYLEEIIFRGLMQHTSIRSLGRWWGMLYVALVFAVLHMGYRSALDMLFVFGVALFFGEVVARTGSILGVTLSHGLTNITLFLVYPFFLAG